MRAVAPVGAPERLWERLASIKSVSVSPNVKYAGRVDYHGAEQSLGTAIGGIVGALVAGSGSMDDQINLYLVKNDIAPERILYRQFRNGLQNDSRFAGKLTDESPVHFELEIVQCMFVQVMFSSQYKTMLAVRARLVDSDGTVLWRDFEIANAFNDAVPGATLEEFVTDPGRFRLGFTADADVVTQRLLKDIAH